MRTAFLFLALTLLLGNVLPRARAQERFPAARPEEAWKLLPRAEPPLPAWALTLCQAMPRTTAGMLELDYLHRANNPLGAVWAGKLRWVAADANRCAYAKSYAEADLRRAGLDEKEMARLVGGSKEVAEAERLALAFARKMTLAAYEVTDKEVIQLLSHFGPEKVVAMVHTLAHANFQQRIFLALGLTVEKGEPIAPLDIRIDARTKPLAPKRPDWKGVLSVKAPDLKERPPWKEHSFEDLRKAVEEQKERKPRIPLPGPERLAKLPPALRERATRIVWSHVSMGYQPLLTKTWFDTMGRFQEEAAQDAAFANTFFWVVTRSNECFY